MDERVVPTCATHLGCESSSAVVDCAAGMSIAPSAAAVSTCTSAHTEAGRGSAHISGAHAIHCSRRTALIASAGQALTSSPQTNFWPLPLSCSASPIACKVIWHVACESGSIARGLTSLETVATWRRANTVCRCVCARKRRSGPHRLIVPHPLLGLGLCNTSCHSSCSSQEQDPSLL